MRLTHKYKYKKDSQKFVFDMKDYRKACQKLGQLEDIEEELGVEMLLLNAVYKNGFVYKNEQNKIVEIKPNDLFLAVLCIQPKCKRFVGCGYYFYFKDYGTTWALTKEELL